MIIIFHFLNQAIVVPLTLKKSKIVLLPTLCLTPVLVNQDIDLILLQNYANNVNQIVRIVVLLLIHVMYVMMDIRGIQALKHVLNVMIMLVVNALLMENALNVNKDSS